MSLSKARVPQLQKISRMCQDRQTVPHWHRFSQQGLILMHLPRYQDVLDDFTFYILYMVSNCVVLEKFPREARVPNFQKMDESVKTQNHPRFHIGFLGKHSI